MRAFAGINLLIPSIRIVERVILKARIQRIAPQLTKANLAMLANFHGVSTGRIRKMAEIDPSPIPHLRSGRDCAGQQYFFWLQENAG